MPRRLPSAPVDSIFQDVPASPSDQDRIPQAVRAYRETTGQPIGGLIDEVDIKGKRAKVRYRLKEKGSGIDMTFSLIRQNGVWTVENFR